MNLYFKKISIVSSVLALLGFLILLMGIGPGTSLAEKVTAETKEKLKGLRVPFVLNKGQMDPQVRFYANTFSGMVYVTDQGKMVYQLPQNKKDQGWVLVEEQMDGLPLKDIKGEKASKTQVSYFIGNDPSKWKTGLATYETIDLGEVHRGIGLKLRAYGGSVEKLYYVSPGQDPYQIRVRIQGAESLKLNDQGELEVQTGNGPVVFSRPRAFQQEGDQQKDVEVSYRVEGNRYGFEVGNYDKNRELVIDPLIQSTYLGGTGNEHAFYAAISGGNVYLTGNTNSPNFPGTSGGAQPALGGAADVFISILTADLKQLVRSTYLGGASNDRAWSLAVSGGNVYVGGSTSSNNFPGTSGGAQAGYGGSTDGFISVLNADLTQLMQSTYLGGSGYDSNWCMTVSGGNVYVAGETGSSNFPGTSGGAQPGYGGSTDAFVSVLNVGLTQLTQSTYLGGSNFDYIWGLAVSGGNVYVAGDTLSTNFPNTSGGAQPGSGGGNDGFVSLLNGGLTSLLQSTYLGGTGHDYAYFVVVTSGNVYVAGETASSNFPWTSEGAQPSYGGGYDGFLSLLTTDLKQAVRSTYLGGTDYDYAWSLAVSGEKIYVGGGTRSANFPYTTGGAQSSLGGGGVDGFLSLLTTDLKQILQSTYLGGTNEDRVNSLVVSGGNIYAAGQTGSTDFPKTSGGAQPGFGGGTYDAFVTLLSADLKKATAMPWMFLLLGN